MAKLTAICSLILAIALSARAQTAPELKWQSWSNAVFAEAKTEQRFVLLDLEAVWCHWCHVMDAKTYSNPAVIKILQSKYIVVKADQDSRPDLSNRYEDYGWPATIVFNADGQEIVKRRGYLPPDEMLSMLRAIIDDPTPGPSVEPEAKLELPSGASLSVAARKRLQTNYLATYDDKYGSWGFNQKFLDWPRSFTCSIPHGAVFINTQRTATGTIRTLKRSCRCRRRICEFTRWPMHGGMIQLISTLREKSGAISRLS